MLHDICTGKTGTITEGKMNVAKMQFFSRIETQDNDFKNYPAFFKNRVNLQQELKELITEAIVSNTDVRVEPNDELLILEPFGQEIEVGMIQFLIDNGEDIQNLFISRNRLMEKIVQLPFCQTRKRMIVVRKVANDPTQARVYIKGAPEYVIPICTETIDEDMQQIELGEDDNYRILEDVVSGGMARHGYKTLSYAYKQIPLDDLQTLMEQYHIESEEFRE